MYVITTVHGTWARDAAWSRPDSTLSTALRRELGDACVLRPFSWSGRNSHGARLRAAAQLRIHIAQIAQEFDGAFQVLVCHSHGGNVALYALRDETTRDRVQRVVCFATPFIHCRYRNLGAGGLKSVVVFLLFAIGVVFKRWVEPQLPGWLHGAALIYVLLACGLGAAAVVLLLVRLLWPSLIARGWSDLLRDAFDSFQQPPLRPEQLLVVRSPSDEASASLGVSMLAAWLMVQVSRLLGRLYTLGDNLANLTSVYTWRQRLGIFVMMLAAGGVLAALGLSYVDESATVFAVGFAAVVTSVLIVLTLFPPSSPLVSSLNGLGMFVQAASGAALIPPVLFLSLASAGFGVDAALLAPWLELSAEALPKGRFAAVQLDDGTLNTGLWHSRPYEEPFAIAAVCEWVRHSRRPGA